MRVRAAVVSFLLLSGGGWALAQGTEFTYQGRLTDAAATNPSSLPDPNWKLVGPR